MSKINKGMLWYKWDWDKAIKEHIKTNDCYILEVYKDTSSNFLKSDWVFYCYKLQGYGNRFKEYKTTIPKKYNLLIQSLKPNDKFKVVDNFGNKINLIELKGGIKDNEI